MTYEKNKKRIRVAVMLCILMCVVCFLIVALILHNFVFVIEEISVTGSTRYDNADIIVSSGIVLSRPMYSINKSDIRSRIMDAYPYIEDVQIKRDLPNKLNIILTESTPACYTEIYGEYFVLSDELRVLEYGDKKGITDGLFELILPNVSRAVLTERIVLASGADPDYIETFISALYESGFSDKIDAVSVDSKFDVFAIYDGLYRIELGSVNDAALKLEVAKAIIDSGKLEAGTKVVIDVSDPSEGTVMANKNLELIPGRQ